MRKLIWMMALLLAILTGCSSAAPFLLVNPVYPVAAEFEDYELQREVREKNALTETFTDSLTNFACTSAAAVLSEEEENINYSPVSLYLALSLTTAGAGGKTKAQLLEALQAQGMTGEELADQCGRLYRLLAMKENEIGRVKPAASLWLEKGGKLKKAFADTAGKNFYAEVYSGDLKSEELRRTMSEWVRNKTSGQLDPQIKIPEDTVMTLFTCLDFEDQWIDEFRKEENKKANFYRADGSTMMAEYMGSTYNPFGYFRGEGFTRASLSMKNGTRMSFILPDEGTSIGDLVSDPQWLKEAVSGGTEAYAQVIFEIPKFDFSSSCDLAKTVERLGAGEIFTPEADLYGITGNQLFLSGIRQQTRIAVDEKGVSAAAFTQMLYAGAAMPQQEIVHMILNRPFMYTVEDNNGVILFMGVCQMPTEA